MRGLRRAELGEFHYETPAGERFFPSMMYHANAQSATRSTASYDSTGRHRRRNPRARRPVKVGLSMPL